MSLLVTNVIDHLLPSFPLPNRHFLLTILHLIAFGTDEAFGVVVPDPDLSLVNLTGNQSVVS